jgi:hypothetical protein
MILIVKATKIIPKLPATRQQHANTLPTSLPPTLILKNVNTQPAITIGPTPLASVRLLRRIVDQRRRCWGDLSKVNTVCKFIKQIIISLMTENLAIALGGMWEMLAAITDDS